MVSGRLWTGSAVWSSYWVSTANADIVHFQLLENSQMKMLLPGGNVTCGQGVGL